MNGEFGLLLLRLVVGGLLIGHGGQKLFGWFGGYGFAGTSLFMGNALRLRPAKFWTALAGLSEFGGGLLLAIGLLSPLGALGILAAMLTAIALTHWPRIWASDNGMEYPLVVVSVAAAVGIAGPGTFSLDWLLRIALPAPLTFIVGLGAVLVGVIAALATRVPEVTQADEAIDELTLPRAA